MPITRTPMIDDDGTGTTGTVVNNAWKTELYNQIDAVPAIATGGVWTPYTAIWTSNDGTPPVLGNGTLSGRYMRIGNWVDVSIVMTIGTTTVIGTASYWVWHLPFAPRVFGGGAGQEVTLRVGSMYSNGAAQMPGTAYGIGSVAIYALQANNGALIGPSVPFTWVPNALMSIRGSYEL